MNTSYGEVDYDNVVEKKQANNKDLFLRLDEGDNEMRIVTKPYQYLVHKYKKEGDAGFGQKVGCSKEHGSCPLCDLGDEPKRRWFLGVISRKTKSYKLLDVSIAVLGSIKKLRQNAKWGDPMQYDINIIVDKNGGATGYYSVQPTPKEPLSAEDQKIKDNDVDFDELKRRTTPPTPQVVQARMDKINGVAPSTSAPASASTKASAPAKKAASPVNMADDDDDMASEFPAYDAQ
jgi:hypothetical protein